MNNRELARVERQYPLAAMDPALKGAMAASQRALPTAAARGDVFLFALPGN